MSEYTVVDIGFTDGDCIKSALKEMGYVFEEHQEPQKLRGFMGDERVQTAHIIIRKKYVGSASNDVGFLRKADGSYEMIISEYDRRVKHSQKLMGDLKQIYGKYKFMKQAKKMGFKVKSTKVDDNGLIKIKVSG